MFYTDTPAHPLAPYSTKRRVWQGVPTIERTARGRFFAAWMSGGYKSYLGNYCVLTSSTDGGRTYSEPIAVADAGVGGRCYDPCLWIDPRGRLWFFWAVQPEHAVWAVRCDDPDAETLVWTVPRAIGYDVMCNKPIVGEGGEWLFPMAVWQVSVLGLRTPHTPGDMLFVSSDEGESFSVRGHVRLPDATFDEPMLLCRADGTFVMYVRTVCGIAYVTSTDGGKTWSESTDTAWTRVSSRFHLRRLPSGNLLLVHHFATDGRDHLCAKLSMDEGRTFVGGLMLDSRSEVSYPDCTVDETGRIYCIYDHGRGSHLRSMRELVRENREILCASFTEAEVLAGQLETSESYLRRVISSLGAFTGTDPYPAEAQIAEKLWMERVCEKKSAEEIENAIYQRFGAGCTGIASALAESLDGEMDALYRFAAQPEKRRACVARITALLHDTGAADTPRQRLVEEIRQYIDSHLTQELTLARIASAVSSSRYYICHLFKIGTGTTITQYIAGRRIAHAKLLLEETDNSIADIAITTGYDNISYFSRVFREYTGDSPTAYRAKLREKNNRTEKRTEKMENKNDALLAAKFLSEPVIRDPDCRFANKNRRFQGIPGIERTPRGRTFVSFYGGMEKEESGNFVVVLLRDRDTEPFGEPYLVVEAPNAVCRTFDPVLWIDDGGRLWLFWSQSYTYFDGRAGVWAAVCEDPDAPKPVFGKPRRFANGVMMNKPVILSTGEWLACCALWCDEFSDYNDLPEERFSNVYCSRDRGESFTKIGYTAYPDRSTDEPEIVELSDGTLWMLIRGRHGIGQSFSDDRGVTWRDTGDSGIGGPCSRFCIRRLPGGRILLVNHHDFLRDPNEVPLAGNNRRNLKAMLSEDDGKTWKGYLLLDEREEVSYPDVTWDAAGNIYIVYDRGRYTDREILMARVTEADILAGALVTDGSYLKWVINKAGTIPEKGTKQ